MDSANLLLTHIRIKFLILNLWNYLEIYYLKLLINVALDVVKRSLDILIHYMWFYDANCIQMVLSCHANVEADAWGQATELL